MRGFRLGSIFGFEIRIDYSWFIIFFLILWTFTFGVFPMTVPGLETGVYIAMGLIGTLLFFASLLAHEISHSLVARTRDVPVEGITLFVFGGMAHTRMEAESPGDEFAIAGIGPVSSLGIAVLFGVIAWMGAMADWSPAIVAVGQYLAFINVALAVFNLLPGFPLDGGRLFRAAAWKYTGDLRKATRWSSNGGKVVGYGLMALGLLQVFAGALIGGLWLLFIGWFVRTAAEAGFRQHVLRESLEGVSAAEMMTRTPQTVPADMTLQDFVDDFILDGRHRAYPVVDGDRLVGLVTLDRVKAVRRDEWSRRTVRDAMRPRDELTVVSPREPMSRVLEQIGAADAGRVVIASDDRVEGIVTRSDLARWIERTEMLEGS
jgi:Zn-dependent protease/predicted transcriptional regulator